MTRTTRTRTNRGCIRPRKPQPPPPPLPSLPPPPPIESAELYHVYPSLANSKRSPVLAAVTRWARDAQVICDLPVVRQTSRPLRWTTYLKPGRLDDAALPLRGSRRGRDAHETAVRVSMRLQKATSGADVSSAHAKAVGAGSDQAATRRRACWNPRTNSCHMCAQGNAGTSRPSYVSHDGVPG